MASSNLFATLGDLLEAEDYPSIVELCDEVLVSEPQNRDALRAKCAALIHENKLPEAISLAKDVEELAFEHAYALYRSGMLAPARTIVDAMPAPLSAGALHLKAQLLYKQHDFAASAETYEQLLNSEEPMVPELRANVVASMTAAGRAAEALERLRELGDPLESFELAFNTATALLAAGKGADAESMLKQAEDLGKNALSEEGLDADEIADELAGVHVQLAYSVAARGDAVAASALLANVLARKPSDKAVAAVAANNAVALRGATELFDSAKKIRSAMTNKDKLLPAQRSLLLASAASISALMNKRQECREAIGDLQREFPSSDAAALAAASLHCRDRAFGKARDKLTAFAEAHPERSMRVRLAMAQLALARGQAEEAEEILADLKLLRSLPGHAAALVALRHGRGDVEGALRALDEAVAACREAVAAAPEGGGATQALPTWSRGFGRSAAVPGEDETRTSLFPRAALVELMMASAAYRLRVGRNEEAAGALEELARGDAGPLRTDQRLSVTAATVLAHARVDSEKAEALADRLPQPEGADALPSIDELLEGATKLRRRPDAMSASQAPRGNQAAAAGAPSGEAAAGAAVGTAVPAAVGAEGPILRTTQEVSEEKLARKREIERKRRERKRAKRRAKFLAKLVERGVMKEGEEPPTPDPERWLPLKLRTNKRGKRKGYVGGAQGAGDVSAKDSKRFDAAARAADKREQAAAQPTGRHVRSVVSSSAAERRRNRRRRR